MISKFVLLVMTMLALYSNGQPLQDQDQDDLKGQTSSLTSSSSSGSLRRAVITFEPESIVPLEFKNRARRKPKGRHLKQAR